MEKSCYTCLLVDKYISFPWSLKKQLKDFFSINFSLFNSIINLLFISESILLGIYLSISLISSEGHTFVFSVPELRFCQEKWVMCWGINLYFFNFTFFISSAILVVYKYRNTSFPLKNNFSFGRIANNLYRYSTFKEVKHNSKLFYSGLFIVTSFPKFQYEKSGKEKLNHGETWQTLL